MRIELSVSFDIPDDISRDCMQEAAGVAISAAARAIHQHVEGHGLKCRETYRDVSMSPTRRMRRISGPPLAQGSDIQ